MSVLATAVERAPRGRALLACAVGLTVALWASAFVAIRYADRELSPGALALGRLMVGSLALGLLVLVRREPMPSRREACRASSVCGVLWFGLYNVALNAAETRIDAGTAAMLVNVGPILIAIFAGLILREGFPTRLFAGCLVSFAGAVIIGLATSRHGVHESLGAVLCVVAAFAYAGGVVAQKPVLRHASPLTVTWLACTIGAISCLPYAGTLVHGVASSQRLDDRLDDLPRGGPDRDRIRHLGLRAGAHDRRSHGLDNLSRAAAGAAVRLDVPGRGSAPPRPPGWRAVPGRRRPRPHRRAAAPGRRGPPSRLASTLRRRRKGGYSEDSIRANYGSVVRMSGR